MNNCKYCKADCALRGEENLKECKGHIPMSNADRIRAMSDEELADFLAYTWATSARAWQKDTGETLRWLQQPAEKPKEEREC